jgi:hypothetical protein
LADEYIDYKNSYLCVIKVISDESMKIIYSIRVNDVIHNYMIHILSLIKIVKFQNICLFVFDSDDKHNTSWFNW